MYLIDDNNYGELVERCYQRTDGLPGLLRRDYDKIPFGKMPYTKPFVEAVPIIPQAEWEPRIKAMQGKFIRNLYTGTPAEDSQNGLNYCWSFSLAQAIKGQRNVDGQPHVDLCPESLGRDVNWRNAGNYCGNAIAAAAKYGFCDRSFSPKRYSLSPSTWKAGWETEALNHRVLEWYELGVSGNMWAETVTALLLGHGVYFGINWLSHAMWYSALEIVNGKIAAFTPNTWDEGEEMLLTGSKAVPDEAYVILSTVWEPK